MKIEVFTKPNCPECVKVKQTLKNLDLGFEEKQLTPDNISEFMQFTRSAPVVFINDEFIVNEDIFNRSFLNKETVEDIDFDF